MTSGIKIAFLCDRLGPYHFARLNAANTHAEIIAIEFSAMDQTYKWDLIKTPCGFQRVTLFSDAPVNMQPVNAVVKRVNNVLSEIKPEVVAIPGWDALASFIALWWCLEMKIPTVLMSDSQEHDEKRVWWKEAVKRRIVRLHSAGFVGGKPHRVYMNSLGMGVERIVAGCDVVDNAYFAEGASVARQNSDSIRKEFFLPDRYFLVSSRFVPKKNLPGVLRAYAKYRRAVGDEAWKLVLLGDGPLKPQIISIREKLGLAEMVLLPGFKQYSDLPVYYGLAGAFVLASTSEQWGLVVNEAMASGLPVIVSSQCGCTPDLVVNGHNGFTFDPFDLDELAGHMAFVSGNTCNRVEMGQASRNIIDFWSLDTFPSNLCNAAEAAMMAPRPLVGNLDKALLWSLIRRHRAH